MPRLVTARLELLPFAPSKLAYLHALWIAVTEANELATRYYVITREAYLSKQSIQSECKWPPRLNQSREIA